MDYQELLNLALNFATAILLGALIGIEREKRKEEEHVVRGIAGLRTFTLIALFGAAAGWLSHETSSPWVLAGGLLIVGAFVVAGYVVAARADPESTGLTTEIAAVVVFLLGAMVMFGFSALAVGLGVVTAAVLAYKRPLHSFVDKLGWDDVYAGLTLLIASFIALPLLPDQPIDPWGALNPYKLWLLVILISSLSLVGYVLTRLLGPARGTALTGLTGGLVSSTAVTLSFAKEGRDSPQEAPALACGILLAWAVMFVRVIVLVAVVNRSLLTHVIVPFAAMAVVVGGLPRFSIFAALGGRRRRQGQPESAEPIQPDRGGEVCGAVRRGPARGQDRAGAFPAKRAVCGGGSCRSHRRRCHHAVHVGIRQGRRGARRGDCHCHRRAD